MTPRRLVRSAAILLLAGAAGAALRGPATAQAPTLVLTGARVFTADPYGAAYAEWAEDRKGMIAPGMLADLAVLSQDIFTIPAPELPRTTSVVTVLGGRIIFDGLAPAAGTAPRERANGAAAAPRASPPPGRSR